MCAHNDDTALRNMKKRKNKIQAWKVVHNTGAAAIHYYFQYAPGWNYALQGYYIDGSDATRIPRNWNGYFYSAPRGCHAWLNKNDAEVEAKSFHTYVLIPVTIDPKDVIVCEKQSKAGAQIVARKVWINKKDWIEAGIQPKEMAA